MGLFNTLCGYVQCPKCNAFNRADIQFKWLDGYSYFEVGNYVYGSDVFSTLDSDWRTCSECEHKFNFYAIGHLGYLYGFCNEIQYNEMKNSFPLDEPGESQVLTLHVSKEDMMNLEKVVSLFREQLLKNPTQTSFIINSKGTPSFNDLICRVPSCVSNPIERITIGDAVYFDPRRSRYSVWEYADTPFTVVHSRFDEETQLFFYTISCEGENIEDVSEKQLLSPENALVRKNEIESLLEDLIAYANDTSEPKTKRYSARFFHCEGLVEYLKKTGKIPEDFSLYPVTT